jgi:hypothetical protein
MDYFMKKLQLEYLFKIFLVASLAAGMSFYPSGTSLSETNTLSGQDNKLLRKNRKTKVTGGGLGPRICEGRTLRVFVSEDGPISVSSENASIRFYIPCKPEDIESLEFSLYPIVNDVEGQLPPISSTVSSRGNFPGNYTHEFSLPERGREYRWYLTISARNSSGDLEDDQVNGYIIGD